MDGSQNERYARYVDPETGRPALGSLLNAAMADAKAYFEAQKELTKLEVSEKIGRAAAYAFMGLVVVLLISTVFLMGSVALSLWLGTLLGSVTLGFLAVAGIYLVLGLLFYWLWNRVLKEKIILAIIRSMHDQA
jgi:uncharacterized membrane protein YobD (UPF0266 family)